MPAPLGKTIIYHLPDGQVIYLFIRILKNIISL